MDEQLMVLHIAIQMLAVRAPLVRLCHTRSLQRWPAAVPMLRDAQRLRRAACLRYGLGSQG